ncbi:MAG: thrombospondin type 3 repeat-containing protein [Patescibacteria group bacterium]
MKKNLLALTLFSVIVLTASAALLFNQNIVAIFGAGNPNDGWTVSDEPALTLGLRAKNRENASTANVGGVYNVPAGLQAPNNNRARWNWELSVNSKSSTLDSYEYYMEIDLDHSTGVNKLVVNVLTQWADNSYGTASTLNGQGVEGPASTHAPVSTVAQQSQNIVFYGLDANLDATYTYTLYAVAAGAGPNGARIATVAITVIVGAGGPLPPDDDGDGVPNSIDQCPNTVLGEVVNTFGCSIQDQINKCATENASDHGEYVSCVVELANKLFKAGTVSQSERKFMINSAAQSSIGK